MSDTAEKIASLETTVFKQEDTIEDMTQKQHEFELMLCDLKGTLSRVDDSQIELKDQFKEYANEERDSVKGVYKYLRSMDAELKKSFKERDEKITNLRIEFAKVNAKMLVYAGIVFTIASAFIQYLMEIML